MYKAPCKIKKNDQDMVLIYIQLIAVRRDNHAPECLHIKQKAICNEGQIQGGKVGLMVSKEF